MILTNEKFKIVKEHLTKQPLIGWSEFIELKGSHKGFYDTTTEDLTISFDWLTYRDNTKVSVTPVDVYNEDFDIEYKISDNHFLELEELAKSLFEFNTENEHPSKHAFVIGE